MKYQYFVGLAFVVGLSVIACGTGTITKVPVGDGGNPSSPDSSTVTGYNYVAIIDLERQERGSDFSCAASNGPGSDIDAVALIRKGEIIGYGLAGSAVCTKTEDYRCKDEECPGGRCKYTDPITSAEGPPDAVINKDSDDKGYLSLNGGILQIRIGNKDGKDPGQEVFSGDQIKVFEVDLTKKTDANGCACAPEKYQVILQKGNDSLTLRPSQFDKANASVCGQSPQSDTQFGCGTSVFDVP